MLVRVHFLVVVQLNFHVLLLFARHAPSPTATARSAATAAPFCVVDNSSRCNCGRSLALLLGGVGRLCDGAVVWYLARRGRYNISEHERNVREPMTPNTHHDGLHSILMALHFKRKSLVVLLRGYFRLHFEQRRAAVMRWTRALGAIV